MTTTQTSPFPGVILATIPLTVTTVPPYVEPEGRFLLAFDSPTLEPAPDWTRLDDIPNLVTSYTVDRGRQYELDRTDTGRATVQIIDPAGVLDPTNPDGPYYGKLQPLIPAAIARRNPVTGDWTQRYRGHVEDFDYDIDPSQRLNRLTLTLVDLYDVISAVEMHPGMFGTPPPEDSVGQIYYPAEQTFHTRIVSILADSGLPRRLWVVAEGNVWVKSTVYSPGESAMSAIQEAADAEFPALANTYCDRKGRLVCLDRRSRFYPLEVSAELGVNQWDYREWKAGDGAAVSVSIDDTAQVRELSFGRGRSKIINSASATPVGIIDSDVPGALAYDTDSIRQFGVRSWSADSLITGGALPAGEPGSEGDLFECKQYAMHYVTNYAQPRDRISAIGFRPLHPDDPRAPALWEFLNGVDISDSLEVTVQAAGGGGFDAEQYFVEGIHEDVRPLTPDYDDVTMRLDLSPRAYYANDPFVGPGEG